MDQVGLWVLGRKWRRQPRLHHEVLSLVLLALLIAVFGVPAASASAKKTYHLSGEVQHDKKGKKGKPGSKNFSKIALRSGSKTVGKLTLTDCNGLAINELTCSGKITLGGFGSGLDVVVRWPCEIGGSGKFTCSSVGEGPISSKRTDRGTILISTGEESLFKAGKRFPVTIRAGG
jgi:hypothetical protein